MKLQLRLEEVADHCGVSSTVILHFISHEWIAPEKSDSPVFDDEDIARIRLICDLRNKMGVNDEAIPIILHLIDQLNCLHRELK